MALAVRVASPPVDGAANEVLVVWLAEQLGVAKSAVSLRSGATGRLKLLRIEGDEATISGKLVALASR
jgi:hypothetical protein